MTRSRFLAVLAGAALALGVTAAPAAAHDTLLASDPPDGAVLDTPPAAVTLDFSANILDLSPALQITDPEGAEVEVSDALIDGTRVTWEVPGAPNLPAGEYGVVWAVTSSDGHPIDGELTFEVDAAWEPVDEEPTISPEDMAASPAATEPADPEPGQTDPEPASTDTETGSDDGDDVTDQSDISRSAEMWFFAGLAVTAVVIVAVVIAMRRGRDPNGPPGQH